MLKFDLVKQTFSYVLYNIILLTFAYLLNRYLQMLMFIVFFDCIQNCFNKRFHSDTLFPDEPIKAIKYCKLITLCVELVYLFLLCKNLNITFYGNLIIIFLIAFGNSLLQYYAERIIIVKSKLNNLETLKMLCKEAKLTNVATNRMIMRYVEKKSYKEIAMIECVEEKSIEQSIRRNRKKLKI